MLLSRLFQDFILIALIYNVIAMEFNAAATVTSKQQTLNNLKQQLQRHQQHHQRQISTNVTTTSSAFCGFMRAMKKIRNEQRAVSNCNAINLHVAMLNGTNNNNLMLNKKENNNDNDSGQIEDEAENENEIKYRNEIRNEDDLLLENSNGVEMSPSPSPTAAIATAKTFPILTTLTLSTTAAIAAAAAEGAAQTTALGVATTEMIKINRTIAAAAAMSIMPLSSVAAVTAAAAATSSSLVTSAATALPQNLKLKRRSLSRPKRYLAFPEGSSFSVAVCFTVGIIGNPRFNFMSFGLNWGVAYDLPNATWILNHLHGFSRHPVPPTVLRRRTRRSLYKEVERVVDNMGYNGRDCMLRALCESRQYFQRNKLSMIGEMLRVIFSLPKQRIYTRELHEHDDIRLYDHAYRKARSIDCATQYDCSFSLLELALGRYSTPPPGYYEEHR